MLEIFVSLKYCGLLTFNDIHDSKFFVISQNYMNEKDYTYILFLFIFNRITPYNSLIKIIVDLCRCHYKNDVSVCSTKKNLMIYSCFVDEKKTPIITVLELLEVNKTAGESRVFTNLILRYLILQSLLGRKIAKLNIMQNIPALRYCFPSTAYCLFHSGVINVFIVFVFC